MFAIPAGMMMGAEVSVRDWWLWNQIPVTLGNIVGGMLLTGMALQVTYRKRVAAVGAEAAGAAPMTGEMVAGR
jgi:formate/nitrite transporter FocA (FNT family)